MLMDSEQKGTICVKCEKPASITVASTITSGADDGHVLGWSNSS